MSCSNKRYFGNMIPVSNLPTAQKDVVLVAGPGIKIEDQSDPTTHKFKFSTQQILALNVVLTLIAKEAGSVRTSPVLKGTVIDRFELSWVYNKTIVSQTLTNTGGLTPPTLVPADVTALYTTQTVTSAIDFTVTGNDGLGQPESVAADTKGISFGNYLWLGHGASKVNTDASLLEAFIEGLTSTIKTARIHTYNATGSTNEKHFVAYPKAWGLGVFTKGIFTGGYLRLKKVGTNLKSELGIGDIETDIIFTNNKGFAEAYYVYETEYDNQNDPVTAFTIS